MEHSYYQKGTHRNTHQNGTLILSKGIHQKEHSYYQKGTLIKMELIGILIKMEH